MEEQGLLLHLLGAEAFRAFLGPLLLAMLSPWSTAGPQAFKDGAPELTLHPGRVLEPCWGLARLRSPKNGARPWFFAM
jgi:hypothetical protein